MSNQKFYAVKQGRKPGIYTSWEQTKLQVNKFVNAEFKAFSNKQDALDYLNYKNKQTITKPAKNTISTDKNSAIAYTDGSYDVESKTYSFGAVVIFNNKQVHISQRFNDSKTAELRNVAGELLAAMHVTQFCLDNNIKDLKIYHDYQGVSKWVTQEWQANKEFTKKYKEYMQNKQKQINISFEWVKAHSNNKYNELADRLAFNATYKLVIKEV
ncbi:viroplasmin family protein [Mycoplasma putrefaciens]|uniref:Ribonuclease H n=1 Tax=Mycoplasma putrefaciens Mput9231 TaxID=1292033 RepID=M9WBQ0_9MOLU|nr:ribonuclease H family protein [Mycoplasma putrefaciens]AGJ90577.1 Ribonuclease H-related protein [Mycoplasma putrefaciens Mput9231]